MAAACSKIVGSPLKIGTGIEKLDEVDFKKFESLMKGFNRADYEESVPLKYKITSQEYVERVEKVIVETYDELMKMGDYHILNASEVAIDNLEIIGRDNFMNSFKLSIRYCAENSSLAGYWVKMMLREIGKKKIASPQECLKTFKEYRELLRIAKVKEERDENEDHSEIRCKYEK